MSKSQLAALLADRPVVEEIRNQVDAEGALPKSREWGVEPALLRAIVSGKPPKADGAAAAPVAEAIVLLHGRPSLLIQNDTFEIPANDEWKARLYAHKSRIEAAIRCVGRVELSNNPDFDWVGTAWVVADNVLVTNRHVALTFAAKNGQGFVFLTNFDNNKPMTARVDFKEEYRTGTVAEVAVEKVVHIEEPGNAYPDLALLQLAKGSPLPPPIALATKAAAAGRNVAAIGYPAHDSRNGESAMAKVFGDVYDVKRLAPGKVVSARTDDWFFTHDCSTLGGNSGSLLLDVETGEAVGLHFGGQFRRANYAVKAPVVLDAMRRAKVTVPAVRRAAVAVPEEIPTRPVSFYADRVGYEKNFLGPQADHEVPLPTLGTWSSDAAPVTGAPAGAKNVLRYMHFSVVLSKSRKLPLFTAVNIDGTGLRQIPRKGDAWFLDPRVNKKYQTDNEVYANNDLDRGHMVRRLDPVWGSQAVSAQANEDTFHYSNACPQHKDLNQKTWNDLEDYVLGNAGARHLKVSVFTGPVLRAADRDYRGVQLPREFWKVAVLVDDATGKLSATAYMLSQAGLIDDLDEFVFGKFRTYQVPVARVEKLTKLHFGKLREADPLAGEEITEALGGPGAHVINGPADLVF